jgi:hypothetical protein
MARRPKVDHVKAAFFREVGSASALVAKITRMPTAVWGASVGAPVRLHPKDVRQVVELAFMGMVAAWEEFVERVLVRYAAGALAAGGYAPTPNGKLSTSIDGAYILVSGKPNFDPKTQFLKVTNPNWVMATANRIFSKHFFGVLGGKSLLIEYASLIRNRVAHSSEKCRLDFKKTAVLFLRPPGGRLRQGYGAGDLLMESAAAVFSASVRSAQATNFGAFAATFSAMAQVMVP